MTLLLVGRGKDAITVQMDPNVIGFHDRRKPEGGRSVGRLLQGTDLRMTFDLKDARKHIVNVNGTPVRIELQAINKVKKTRVYEFLFSDEDM